MAFKIILSRIPEFDFQKVGLQLLKNFVELTKD